MLNRLKRYVLSFVEPMEEWERTGEGRGWGREGRGVERMGDRGEGRGWESEGRGEEGQRTQFLKSL